ncbi:diguanylate cyclase [Candidatus Bipolaricaulota bacterium]
MMKANEGHRKRAVAIRAIALFAVVAAVSFPVGMLIARSQISDQLDTISQSSFRILELQHEIVHSELSSIASDLLFLAGQNELHAYLEIGNRDDLEAITLEYLEMSRQKSIYDQIRFLDEHGMEMVRVNFNDGSPSVVPDHLLQSKAARYYFYQTLSLDDGNIFVSVFDLNVEQGVVETPWKPMIRFGTPVYDAAGQPQGIVILNYLGRYLFDALGQAIEGTNQRTFLANWESYWLWGPDPSVEWGFMHHGTGVHTVDTSFPGAWEQMASAHEGQFRTDDGLFTFITVHPVEEVTRSTSIAMIEGEHEYLEGIWKLISFVPASVLSAIEKPIWGLWRITQGLLMILAVGTSWFYARLRVLRAEYRRRIEYLAKYDSLTGACNRHYFEASIADEEARARRYRHPISFLMIDITRFKHINDTYGHKVGDEVLVEVTAILRSNVREVDVVVRYGGDEFVIMFPETPGEADVARRRILGAINELNASGAKFEFPIVLAVGSAHWEPASGETIEDALSHADEQMYEHKQSQHEGLDKG